MTPSNSNEDEFYNVLNAIAQSDGDEDTLVNQPLPDALKNKYADMRDLLEQTANDLSIFYYNTTATAELGLGLRQESRLEQYDMVKDPKQGRELANIFNYKSSQVTLQQLVEMLSYCARWPGSTVDIGGGNHATSLYITPNGNLKYYDPNMKGRVPEFESIEALADHIFKFKYDGKVKSNGTVDITLDLYKFLPRGEKVPDNIRPSLPQSQNAHMKFTELHADLSKCTKKTLNILFCS